MASPAAAAAACYFYQKVSYFLHLYIRLRLALTWPDGPHLVTCSKYENIYTSTINLNVCMSISSGY